MHLTSITLFIRGDKQSAEKRRQQRPRRTFVPYETFIEHWQASRFSKISPSQRNAAKHARARAGICANEYINLLLGNSINLQLHSGAVYTKFVLCDTSIV